MEATAQLVPQPHACCLLIVDGLFWAASQPSILLPVTVLFAACGPGALCLTPSAGTSRLPRMWICGRPILSRFGDESSEESYG